MINSSVYNDYGDLDDKYAAKSHTHSEYATTATVNSKFDSSNITYSSSDLTAGSSSLTTGKYYFKYD